MRCQHQKTRGVARLILNIAREQIEFVKLRRGLAGDGAGLGPGVPGVCARGDGQQHVGVSGDEPDAHGAAARDDRGRGVVRRAGAQARRWGDVSCWRDAAGRGAVARSPGSRAPPGLTLNREFVF